MKNDNKTVFVGVSGGVDSSVSLALLKDAGFNVVGCFIKTWQPDFIECTWIDERRDAMRICAKLGVPFITIDAEKEYKDAVGQYMIDEYKAGRTPNPDVMCNKEVKFGVFLNKAVSLGADYVATGHYARNIDNKLYVGIDQNKDQSYFLWTLTNDQLSKIMFPIGGLKKSRVRELAKKYNLLTENKKDSQGVCFLGEIDMKDFLKHYIDEKPGDVLNEKGEIIGSHDGAMLYALGERHGFKLKEKTENQNRLYVVSRNLDKNTITVSENSPITPKKENGEVKLKETVWREEIDQNKIYKARTRYQQDLSDCKIKENKVFWLEESPLSVSGQSLVVYDGEKCVGGGIID